DEDFDGSYESLLSLAATLGDVRPRRVPENVIESLPNAAYSQWATEDADKRCPICLDDYADDDPVLRLPDCGHWLHKGCLEQWLRTARTCPVCRSNVRSRGATPQPPPQPSTSALPDDPDGDDSSSSGSLTPPWRRRR
ncbi:hypothetical protein JAAARDRAFT_134088, partial [Jaapia argillacea MUCL 33604]